MADTKKVVAAQVEARGYESVEQILARMKGIQKDFLAQAERSVQVQQRINARQVEYVDRAKRAASATQLLTDRSGGLMRALGGMAVVTGGTGGTFMQLANQVNAARPALEAIEAKFTTVNSVGTKFTSTAGKMAAGVTALGAALPALAIAAVVGDGLEKLADGAHQLGGEVKRLNDEFARGEARMSRGEGFWNQVAELFTSRNMSTSVAGSGLVKGIDIVNHELAKWGEQVEDAAVGQAKLTALMDLSKRSLASFTTDVEKGRTVLFQHTKALLDAADGAMAVGTKTVWTKDKIVALNESLNKQAKLWGDDIPDNLKRAIEETERWGKIHFDVDLKARSRWEEQRSALEDLKGATKAFSSEMARLDSTTVLTVKGQAALDAEFGALVESATAAGKAIKSELVGAYEMLTNGAGQFSWGIDWKKQAAEIGTAFETQKQKQLDGWKKADDELKAHREQSIQEVGDLMAERWGEAGRASVTEWSHHMNSAVAALIPATSQMWAQAAQAMAGGSRALGGGGGNAGTEFMSAAHSTGASSADQLAQLDARIRQKQGEQQMIGRTFRRGDGFNDVHMKARAQEIKDLQAERDRMLGNRPMAGAGLEEQFGAMAKRRAKTPEEKQLEQMNKGIAQVVAAVTTTAKATAAVAENTRKSVGYQASQEELARAAGISLEELASSRDDSRLRNRLPNIFKRGSGTPQRSHRGTGGNTGTRTSSSG